MPESQWDKTVTELREGLVAGTNSDGVELQAETDSEVGKLHFVTIVESAGGDAETQRAGYRQICDLMQVKLNDGADQVLGCLVIDGDPDADALAAGLDGMLRSDGTFTPVLPLSEEQARAMVDADVALLDVIDPATALLEVAASRSPLTREVALTALEEIDELVARHTASE